MDNTAEPQIGPEDETARQLRVLSDAAQDAAFALLVFQDLPMIRDHWERGDFFNNVKVYHIAAARKAQALLAEALAQITKKDGGQ